MALIICPECKSKISNHAKECVNCGFPIKDFIDKNNIIDFNKELICPKCAFVSGGYAEEYPEDPIYLKCKFCNTILIQTENTGKEGLRKFIENKEEDYYKTLAIELGNNQFSENAYNCRISANKKENEKTSKQFKQQTNQPTSQIKCPYCNSTNTKKITTANRIGSTMLFGVFSKKLTKEWHCNNCGSDF